ncbi:MAG: hypothetical protein IJE71_07375 [Clostridia bacterium]|nr:hypothetical protein [Clostridia bacterium]
MGIIAERRRKARARRIHRRLVICGIVTALGFAASSQGLRTLMKETLRALPWPVQVFAGDGSAQAELTLPQRNVCALQLGVFDSEERAKARARELADSGVSCIVWQRDKLRIVSAVALTRDALGGVQDRALEAYVIEDSLPRVDMRITAEADAIEDVQAMLTLPDSALMALMAGEEPLEAVIFRVRNHAQAAIAAHPENELYTDLAENLLAWCALMEDAEVRSDGETARGYAALTMYTLAGELRQAVASMPSDASTASAQRTPSTAAEVMPPA